MTSLLASFLTHSGLLRNLGYLLGGLPFLIVIIDETQVIKNGVLVATTNEHKGIRWKYLWLGILLIIVAMAWEITNAL